MLNNSIFRKVTSLLFAAVFLISCDTEFTTIGTDIVGDDHFGLTADDYDVNSMSQKTGAVQSNNLPINPLGVFNNGAFGITTANFVTQVDLRVAGPTFNNVTLAKIKSVVLNVPYFSTYLETKQTSDGVQENIYKLDSVYGGINNKLKLKVYENRYYLRDLDPSGDFQTAQRFYSDQNSLFDGAKGIQLNDSQVPSQNDEFVFRANELITEGEEDAEDVRAAPGMRLDLNKEFFYNKIFATDKSNLTNSNVFKNYFRGLYFKADTGSENVMALMNFAQGTITITYEDTATSENTGDPVEKTLILGLTGNTVSLLEHTSTSASQAYENFSDPENIYVKGGEGSIAYIDLFGGGNSTALEEIRENVISKNWLINEANLVFYVDQSDMQNTIDPNRLYLYDSRNSAPVVDYYFDGTTNSSKPKYAKITYGGIAKLTGSSGDESRKATEYKIRITEHIKNVLFKDSTNVRLGLAVTENIATVSYANLRTPLPQFSKLPVASVLSPLGTVLYGSGPSVPADKRLKLQIYYTKPN